MSQTARQPDARREPPTESDAPSLLSIEEIQQDPLLASFITSADKAMAGLGYTEHGFRHANLTARIAFNVLSRLGMDATNQQLGRADFFCADGFARGESAAAARQFRTASRTCRGVAL